MSGLRNKRALLSFEPILGEVIPCAVTCTAVCPQALCMLITCPVLELPSSLNTLIFISVCLSLFPVALQLLTNHYEQNWKYYCLPSGWGSFGTASEDELLLTKKIFWGVFDSLSQRVRAPLAECLSLRSCTVLLWLPFSYFHVFSLLYSIF